MANPILTGLTYVAIAILVFLALVGLIKSRYRIFTNRDFVLLFRRGKLVKQGYGGGHFIIPFIDEIIVLTTTIQTQAIQASEVITSENQDVVIKGFVVWRIEDPVKAYQSISGSQNTGVMNEINNTLSQLVESIIRTTVARLTLDQVLRERSLIIAAILEELLPVVGPLGIVINTAEIRHVDVVDQDLFNDLQEKYRQEAKLKAAQVKIETDKEIQKKQANSDQEVRIFRAQQEESAGTRELEKEKILIEQQEKMMLAEEKKLRAVQKMEKERQAIIAELNKKTLKIDSETQLIQVELDAESKKRREILEKVQVEAEKKKLMAAAEAESIRMKAKAQQEAVELAAAAEANRLMVLAEAKKKNLLAEAEGKKAVLMAEAEGLREKVKAQGYVNEAMIMQELIKQLPEIAASMKVGDINWLNMPGSNQNGDSPLGIIPKNMVQIMGLAKTFGLDLEQLIATIRGKSVPQLGDVPTEEASKVAKTESKEAPAQKAGQNGKIEAK